MKQITHISEGRDILRALLLRYNEYNPAESTTVQLMIDFLDRQPACFERTTQEGHFTGSAWIVHPNDSKVLLTHHRKLNMWLQLGGHADGVPDLLNVAMQEAREESGISQFHVLQREIFDIDIHVIPARKLDPEHLHYDVRFLLRAATDEYTVSDESHDLAWIDTTDLTSYTTEHSMMRMALKWNSIKNR